MPINQRSAPSCRHPLGRADQHRECACDRAFVGDPTLRRRFRSSSTPGHRDWMSVHGASCHIRVGASGPIADEERQRHAGW